MKDIIVTSQSELDAMPVDFDGRIIIEFGTRYNRAIVKRLFKYPVVARGNSSVVARENSSVEARENSSVVAWENSSVVACGNSSVVACGNSSVEAWENSSVVACGNSSVVAWENSSVVACGNSSVEAWENSSVVACGNSSVVARENSSVVAWENSSVVARGNSSVVARENSSVEARENSSVVASGNSQVCNCSRYNKVSVSANARIVYNPRTIDEYCEHYQIERTEDTVKLFKAVHKRDGKYVADADTGFEYQIGKTAFADSLDTNVSEDCGHGIHMAHKEWCVDYGRSWKDLAIIEVEAKASGIVVPVPGCGKVRAAEVKVLREVPLEECGLLGKMIAARKEK